MKAFLSHRAACAGLFVAIAAAAFAQTPPSRPSDPPDADQDTTYTDERQGDRAGKNDRVQIFGSNEIAADEKITGDVVAVMGGNVVDGSVSHDLVSVMGGNVVNGSVGHDAVAVMGGATINGTVGHNVVAVMGGVTLGPDAIIRGDVVSVMGSIHRAPGAIVRGRIVSGAFSTGPHFGPRTPNVVWARGRRIPDWPIFWDHYQSWRWILTFVFLGFYVLLALLFPKGIRRCGDVLVERPGLAVLATILSLLAIPLICVLLIFTIVGIPVAVGLVPCAIVACCLFGKASLYALIGRGLSGDRLPAAGAVLIGGALCALAYLVPILGFLISFFLLVLGFGCAVTALLHLSRKAPPAAAAAPAGTPPPAAPPPAPAAMPEPVPAAPAAGPIPLACPTETFSAGLPRAGFWIRMGALFIDSVIISAVFGSLVTLPLAVLPGIHLAGVHNILPLAIYGAIMWKLKGTTIGGMVFGLRVVRLDGKPLEWETVVVRALSCFLSTFFWLGFF